MNRTKIGVCAGSSGRDCELIVRVQSGGFFELLLDADDGVRLLVMVDPGNRFPRLHGDGRWIKHEVFDLDLVLSLPGCCSSCHIISPGSETEIENDQDA